MSKRVVIVSPAYPYRGGQALVEAYLFETLTKKGYDCHTISFKLLYPKIFFPGQTQFDKSGTRFFEHDDKIQHVINSINPFSWIKAAREIKKISPDFTLFVWWMPFFGPCYYTIARLVKKWSKSKIAFLVENYISHENRWFDKISCKLTMNHADLFLCQSSFIKNNIAKNHNQPIFQTTLSVYDCYDLNKYDEVSARKELNIKTSKVILFFGLIRPYKGLAQLIRTFKLMREKDDDVTLLAVGECYGDDQEYIDLIAAEGLTDRVIFINKFIDNEDIEPYFKASDVVVLPYKSASQSGILMMAYGFKKPVVVTDVGGLAELVTEGKTGSISLNNEPVNLEKSIAKVLYDSETNYRENIANIAESLGYKDLDSIFKN